MNNSIVVDSTLLVKLGETFVSRMEAGETEQQANMACSAQARKLTVDVNRALFMGALAARGQVAMQEAMAHIVERTAIAHATWAVFEESALSNLRHAFAADFSPLVFGMGEANTLVGVHNMDELTYVFTHEPGKLVRMKEEAIAEVDADWVLHEWNALPAVLREAVANRALRPYFDKNKKEYGEEVIGLKGGRKVKANAFKSVSKFIHGGWALQRITGAGHLFRAALAMTAWFEDQAVFWKGVEDAQYGKIAKAEYDSVPQLLSGSGRYTGTDPNEYSWTSALGRKFGLEGRTDLEVLERRIEHCKAMREDAAEAAELLAEWASKVGGFTPIPTSFLRLDNGSFEPVFDSVEDALGQQRAKLKASMEKAMLQQLYKDVDGSIIPNRAETPVDGVSPQAAAMIAMLQARRASV